MRARRRRSTLPVRPEGRSSTRRRRKIQDGPFTSYVYTGEVLLPVTVTAKAGATTLSLDAARELAGLRQDLRARGREIPSRYSRRQRRTRRAGGAVRHRRPTRTRRAPPPSPPMSPPAGVLWVDAPKLSLQKAEFFPADAGLIDQGAPQTLTVTPERMTLALKPVKAPLQAVAGVLALTDSGGQTEFLDVDATQSALPSGTSLPATTGFLQAILLAFAGGLILNLMPCVLPVLAIKALALARLSGTAKAHVRQEAALRRRSIRSAWWWRSARSAASRSLFGPQAAG